MSWTLLREAQRDSTLGARQMGRKMVLMFLARRADDSGLVKVGGRVVAEETGLDHRRVRRLLDELEEMGRIDLVSEGSAGRGRAHTWRVLDAAEWEARRLSLALTDEPEKGAPMPPIRAEGKGGVTHTEKGASPPTLEQTQNPPSSPHEAEEAYGDVSVGHFLGGSRKSPERDPALPGLGRGEEGLGAIGRARAAGRAGQSRRELEERERRRRDDQYDQLARSPEALEARRALRAHLGLPRATAGGGS